MAQAISIVVAGASLAALSSQPALRATLTDTLSRWTGYNAPGGIWRIAAILLALANLKNLPGVWHLRFFRALVYQIYFQPTPIPPHALFQPIVTSTRTPLLETDYNMHKSNSTYFSDMDISRTHLFTAIIRNGIKKNSRLYGAKKSAVPAGATEGTRGRHLIALGGISCLFKREILPYTKYEMWTRVLCWDRKWFYLVTHLVKPGVGKPKTWTLQPWRKVKGSEVEREKLMGAVYATAIAKYVIKRGRITVPPEQALVDADMVPVKPEGWVYHGETAVNGNGSTEDMLPQQVSADEWNWDVIEKERLRGLEVAQKFADMDGMHEYFDGGKDGALGEYADLLF
ncbi:hypothetical protein HBH70_019670 [Parastagonospora nodorum]|nr:hypothetical protein HBH52_077670 [Parastagonospora nodorum]KAH4007546.1 hypothetical protein HBI10_004590 [Parastagonospora nodorum]KAH4023312.1 hypothetical protein HBI13_086300 [Parastagonospora nodorum]KAH4069097.1 hypothetical protein HBH50_108690 [Parastagonospora nodorum]KAH4088166.1 hypothetical protein HBH48_125660 [Parastagonospora nodorum]